MKKYYLKGLDCARCASEIEEALRKNKGLEYATVNFATKTLMVDAESETLARHVIRGVEPSVEVVSADSGHLQEEGPMDLRQALRIAVSAVLFIVGTVFNERLHETPYSIGEYAVLLPAYLLVGYPVLKSALIDLIHGKVFGEMFLMAVATGGALFI
ncbi:MAG TPA: cation transporter, partial [Rectinemataceae bacterium]|nr:cation transporter [Rectinemataceae bacterium]